MSSLRLTEIPSLKETEPTEVLEFIDNNLPSDLKKLMFPNLEEFCKSEPKNLNPLFEHGIRKSKIIGVEKIGVEEYRTINFTKFWNTIALIYAEKNSITEQVKFFLLC